ncbi:MAG: hypothetical protein JW967_04490 [Dehalococcoidales bacterium]|nr:hypothetical protein [Dehalococcoidales bacterium]
MKRMFSVMLALVLALTMLVSGATVLAMDYPDPCSGPIDTNPVVVANPGNPSQTDYANCVWVKYNIGGETEYSDNWTAGYSVDWTLSADGKYVAFANASPDLTAVIVKGATSAYLYEYDPAVDSDCGLQSPPFAAGGIPQVSHVVFIWCGGTTTTTTTTDTTITTQTTTTTEVGGDVNPVNKALLLIPAIALGIALLSISGIIIGRRIIQK